MAKTTNAGVPRISLHGHRIVQTEHEPRWPVTDDARDVVILSKNFRNRLFFKFGEDEMLVFFFAKRLPYPM